ncbi:hypothetical protein LTR47_009940 [Exophiala xenobiotica]|nr:hypothetical protein LTR72_011572 [Exophiala xenobiotica]KAK5224183.1 hypothetical protein LTR47_009940 [Exophiala xenobiotica]KAK5250315.1 hypothetical protein LTS06_004893 [Exophiala xenobiotica]KAK5285429.1 hypothetical protein LTR14_010965 [Exophiala xenobiotica]KAK5345774.1 hypothetical protein LTR61_010475 [Exophiala xenobiotica]
MQQSHRPFTATLIRGRNVLLRPVRCGQKRQVATTTTPKGQTYPASIRLTLFTVFSVAVAALTAKYLLPQTVLAEAPAPPRKNKIRLSEVRNHGSKAQQQWVIRGSKVYDITDWIPNHPRGDVIFRAVGGIVDTYWDIGVVFDCGMFSPMQDFQCPRAETTTSNMFNSRALKPTAHPSLSTKP